MKVNGKSIIGVSVFFVKKIRFLQIILSVCHE